MKVVSGTQSRRHGGALVGLAPQTMLQVAKLKYETLKISGMFVKFECQVSPARNVKPPAQT